MNAAHCIVLGLAIAVEGGACSAQETSNTLQLPSASHMRLDLALAGDNAAVKASSDFHPGTMAGGATIVAPAAPAASAGLPTRSYSLSMGYTLGWRFSTWK